MFVSKSRLPHLLSPQDYYCEEQYQRELEALLLPAWHAVGTTNELKRDGDFITCELLGHPIQVRVFDGQLRALSNICAHRHCLISSKTRGRSRRMKCQYHGWEYGEDGVTRKIPEPKNFAPFSGKGECIPVYQVDTCGQIVWVCLKQGVPDLPTFLGKYYEIIKEKFGSKTKQFMKLNVAYKANWKVPVENSLEAYHVPSVHQNTFRVDPGEDRSNHYLDEHSTSFETPLPFSPHSRLDNTVQRCESSVMRMLGVETSGMYWQHHVFPNLLMSFTDAINLIHSVVPTGPRTSTAWIRQFGNTGNSSWGPRRIVASGWGHFKALITKQIMKEDLALIPDVQAGLEKSKEVGVLGRCEERIHAFQEYVINAVNSEQDDSVESTPTISISNWKS